MNHELVALRFEVRLTVPGRTEPLCDGAFSECSGLEQRADVRSIRVGGRNHGPVVLAGPVSGGQLTLKRGMTHDDGLWTWFDAVHRDGGRGLRARAEVVLRSPDGSRVDARWRLSGCLPVRLRGPSLDALTGGVAVEEVEVAYEHCTFERGVR